MGAASQPYSLGRPPDSITAWSRLHVPFFLLETHRASFHLQRATPKTLPRLCGLPEIFSRATLTGSLPGPRYCLPGLAFHGPPWGGQTPIRSALSIVSSAPTTSVLRSLPGHSKRGLSLTELLPHSGQLHCVHGARVRIWSLARSEGHDSHLPWLQNAESQVPWALSRTK